MSRIIGGALVIALLSQVLFHTLTALFVQRTETQRRMFLVTVVTMARNTIDPVIADVRAGRLSRAEGLVRVRNTVRRMVYQDQRGPNYVFMSAYDGTMLVQPYEPLKEQTNQWDLRDTRGTPIIQELIRVARSPSRRGFVTYLYRPPDSPVPEQKLAYAVGIPELRCYIGTGCYLQLAQKDQHRLLQTARIGSVALLLLLLFPITWSIRELQARNRDLARESEERWRAREELAISEARLQLALDGANDGLWDWQLDTAQVYFSPRWYTMLGYVPDDFASGYESWRELVHPDDIGRVEEVLASVHTGPQTAYQAEFRMRTKDGHWRWILSRGRVVSWADGQRARRMVGTHSDMTERREAEERLRESERNFRMLVEAIPEVFFTAEASTGRLLYASPAFETVFGRPVPAQGQPSGEWVEYVASEDRQAFVDALTTPSQGDRAGREGVFQVIRPGGEVRFVRMRCSPAADESGRPFRVVGVAEDVTERRRMEAGMQHTQRLESLGVLAGGVAHDFNNLLTSILGNAALALELLPQDTRAGEYVRRVETASQRAAELTGQLLAYSGRGKFVVENIDLALLVTEMGRLLATVISKRVTLTTEFSEDIPQIAGDAAQIRQVVMNLITNASEAIGDGEGRVTVCARQIEADRALLAGAYLSGELPPGAYVELRVSDDGCGMDAETQARVFDPFFTTKFTGRGLGMAAVLGIVRGHGGAIRVESAPGHGTTVTVILPALLDDVAQEGDLQPAVAEPVEGTILVVDDEPEVRRFAEAALIHAGFSVLTAEDGREGVDLFRRYASEVAAVVMDLTMPRMGAEDAVPAICALRPGVRILLSSGYSEEDVTARFSGGMVAGFIQKPYRPADLVEKIRQVLAR